MKSRHKSIRLRPADITIAVMTLVFVIILICPLFSLFSKAFLDSAGEFAGLGNYIEYFSTPSLSVSVTNTLTVSCAGCCVRHLVGISLCVRSDQNQYQRENVFSGMWP